MPSRIVYMPPLEKKTRAYVARRRLRGLYAALGCMVFAALLAGMIAALRHPRARLSEIAVSGLEAISEQSVRDAVARELAGSYAFVIPRGSFFLTRPRTLAAMLERAIPRIKTAAVVKEFPDTLRVSVLERSPWGIMCQEAIRSEVGGRRSETGTGSENPPLSTLHSLPSVCVYIDETGFAFEPAPHSSGSLVIKVRSDGPPPAVGAHAVEPGLMERFRFLGGETERVAGTRVVEYRLLSGVPSEIRTLTEEGFEVIFRRDDDFENVFRVLDRVLRHEIREKRPRLEYIDLRFGNKVFYKLRS